MANRIQDTVDSLDDLLDEERMALLDGNLDHIGRLMGRKEALIDALNDQNGSEYRLLSELNTKVVRNQILLKSALEGIQNVAKRLAAVRQVKSTIDTYDAQGRRKKVDMPTKGTVEKRA